MAEKMSHELDCVVNQCLTCLSFRTIIENECAFREHWNEWTKRMITRLRLRIHPPIAGSDIASCFVKGGKCGVWNMIAGRITLMETNQILSRHLTAKSTFTIASASNRRRDNKRRSSEANKWHMQLRALSFISQVNEDPKPWKEKP